VSEVLIWTDTGIFIIAHIFGGPACPVRSLGDDTGALPRGGNAANLLPPSNAKEVKSAFNILSAHSVFPSMVFMHKVFVFYIMYLFLVSNVRIIDINVILGIL